MERGLPVEVACVVRGMLAENNISGARLAEELHRAPSYVSERQTGQRAWTMTDLDVIAHLLGVEPMTLLAEVSRRARLARDARDAAVLGSSSPEPRPEPHEDAPPTRRRKRRTA
jgi:hypothetical protein